MCKKHKKVCRLLNYFEDLLILASAIIGCVSISDFGSAIGIPKDITRFALNICAITAEIKKQEHGKIVLLGKAKLTSIEPLISNALSNSYISLD